MGTAFCPLCKSIMKDGICSNRNCGNSQFEIEFNSIIKKLKETPSEFKKSVNNSYIVECGLFENQLSYSLDDDKLKGFDEKCLLDNNDIPKNIDILIKELLRNDIQLNIKNIGLAFQDDELIFTGFKHSTIKEMKKIPKAWCNGRHSTRIYKHYFEFYQKSNIHPKDSTKHGDNVLATNDFVEWDVVGKMYFSKEYIQETFMRNLYVFLANIYKASRLWTLQMIDSETGLRLKTYFDKEYAYKLFKDREIKEGKQKRTALKHIVNDYERNKPNKVLVKEHLRGDMIFEWRGITFKLHPPIMDEKRINNI